MQKQLTQAEIKQREDAKALLQNAIIEREEYVKIALRLENNLRVFVERSNFEIASLARTIAQKDENIRTLKSMVDGFFVEPTPPVIAQAPEEPKPVQQGIQRTADDGQRRGNAHNVHVVKEKPVQEEAKGLQTGELAVKPGQPDHTNGQVVSISNPAKDDSDAEVAH